jgi:hypothetical protein
MTQKSRTKKVITDLSFEHDMGHVALVGPAVGGPANLQDYSLILRSAEGFTEELIEKASQIKVTLPVEQFLEKFFGMYSEDTLLLAKSMGYVSNEQSEEPKEVSEDYVQSSLETFEIMKAMNEQPNPAGYLCSLGADDYIAFLQDQERIEKAFEESEKITKSKVSVKESESKDLALESGGSTNASVEKKKEPSGSININKGTSMADKEVKTVVADVEKELVEKSVLVDVQKALDEQVKRASELEAIVKQFEQEKKDLIVKARKEKLQATVKSQEQAEVLFKALGLVEDEGTFDEVLKALGSLQELADKSDLFKSVGAEGEVEQKVEEGNDIQKAVRARLVAKYSEKSK